MSITKDENYERGHDDGFLAGYDKAVEDFKDKYKDLIDEMITKILKVPNKCPCPDHEER